jgi:hypothetical protein
MGSVYDPIKLIGVTTVRARVAVVLQMILEPIIAVSQARTCQLRRIQ